MAVKNLSAQIKGAASGAAKGAIGSIPIVGGVISGAVSGRSAAAAASSPAAAQAGPTQAPKGYHWSVEKGKWVRTRAKRLTLSAGHLRLLEMLLKAGKSSTGRMRK